MTILGVGVENRLFGQSAPAIPPPASTMSSAQSGPGGEPSAPVPGKTRRLAPGEAVPEGISPLGTSPGGARSGPAGESAGAGETGGSAPGNAGTSGAGNDSAATSTGNGAGNQGDSAGLGGDVGANAAADLAPAMIGDQSPYSLMRALTSASVPTPYPPPHAAVGPFARTSKSIAGIVPSVRGLKIADNQSPRPTDRVFSSFNYFDNVNSALNQRLGAPIQNMIVYRQIYGFEKTFFGGTSSAFGNVNVFSKLILWENDQGSLVSAGLAVDIPTGPSSFAGYPTILGKNVTDLQPFLGYIFTNGGDWFLQGFTSLAVPTDSALPTMVFLDAALGYYAYRNTDADSLVTAVVPRFETHVNVPLDHSGWNVRDTYGTPTVVDLTFGLNTEFRKRSILTLGYALPVTGPAPFSGEFILQFNWLFGSGRQRSAATNPPPLTGG